MNKTRCIPALAAAAALVWLAGVGPAQAREIFWSFGIGFPPGMAFGAGNAYPVPVPGPDPLYMAPPPPMYALPPRIIYHAPPPVYYAPPQPMYFPPPPAYYLSPPVIYDGGPVHHHYGYGRPWIR